MQITLTEAAKSKKVAFAGRALPLFLRSFEDLKKLAIIAIESKNPALLRHFETIPTLAELRADKVSSELPELPEQPQIIEQPKKQRKGNGRKKSTTKNI